MIEDYNYKLLNNLLTLLFDKKILSFQELHELIENTKKEVIEKK